jgi:hypothetical protein
MRIFIGVIASSMLLMACESPQLEMSSQLDAQAGRMGKVRIHAQAENADVAMVSAKVEIQQVQIRNVDGHFLTFTEAPFELDLLSLTGSVSPLLVRARMPDGDYDHIRLITADRGEVAFADGTRATLDFPSGPQTGIKVFLDQPIQVRNGVIKRVSLVFDLSRSFVQRGNGGWGFKPVVRADVTEYVDQNPDGSTETPPVGDGSSAGDTDGGSGSTGGDGSGDSDGPGGFGDTIDFPPIA